MLPPCLPSNMPAPCSGVGELNTRGPFTSQTTEPHPQPLHHILTEAPAFWVLWSMTSLGICTCCSQIPPLPCLQLSLPLSAPFICPSVSRSLCHFLPLSEYKLNPSSAAAAVTQLSYTRSTHPCKQPRKPARCSVWVGHHPSSSRRFFPLNLSSLLGAPLCLLWGLDCCPFLSGSSDSSFSLHLRYSLPHDHLKHRSCLEERLAARFQ